MEGSRLSRYETVEAIPPLSPGSPGSPGIYHETIALGEGGVTPQHNGNEPPGQGGRYETVDAFDFRGFQKAVTETVAVGSPVSPVAKDETASLGGVPGSGETVDKQDDEKITRLQNEFNLRTQEIKSLKAKDDWIATLEHVSALLEEKELLEAVPRLDVISLQMEKSFALMVLQRWANALDIWRDAVRGANQASRAFIYFCRAECLLNAGDKAASAERYCEKAMGVCNETLTAGSSPWELANLDECRELMCRIKDALEKYEEAEELEAQLPAGFVSSLARASMKMSRKVNRSRTIRAKYEQEANAVIVEANNRFAVPRGCQLRLTYSIDDKDISNMQINYRIEGPHQDFINIFHHALNTNDQPLLDLLLLDRVTAKAARGTVVRHKEVRGATCIHLAALTDRADVIDTLNKAGHDLNPQAADQLTPLNYAAGQGNLAALRALLDLGAISGSVAHPTIVLPPLHSACFNKRLDAMALLIKGYNHDVYSPSEVQGDTALIYAVVVPLAQSKGNNSAMEKLDAISCAAVEYLLTNGAAASINYRGMKGNTALHWAAMLGFPMTVAALLRAQASTSLKDSLGRTPKETIGLDNSFNKRFREVKRLLKEATT